MYQLSGYDRSGFSDGVTPCSFSSDPIGRITAAEWIRTAYHDMSTANASTGAGGLDASIMYDMPPLLFASVLPITLSQDNCLSILIWF